MNIALEVDQLEIALADLLAERDELVSKIESLEREVESLRRGEIR